MRVVIFTVFILIFLSKSFAQQSASDIYCEHLQLLQAQAIRDKKNRTPLDAIFEFVNSLTKKISLEELERTALEKRMTFEEFQKWAKETHSITVNDHFKAKYLGDYIKNVCGEITYSATFSSEPDPEMSSSAEKQFDPKGHPYAEDVSSAPTTSPSPPSKDKEGSEKIKNK